MKQLFFIFLLILLFVCAVHKETKTESVFKGCTTDHECEQIEKIKDLYYEEINQNL